MPVSAGSPKTPSTSSRSWNASPSGSPNGRVRGEQRPGRPPASAAPICSGRVTVYRAAFIRITVSAPATEPSPTPDDQVEVLPGDHLGAHHREQPRTRGASAPAAARTRGTSGRPRPRTGPRRAARCCGRTRAGSPRQAWPACSSAKSRCTDGWPRRRSLPSMMSSWISAKAWNSSSAAAAVTISSASSGRRRRASPSSRTSAAAACRRRARTGAARPARRAGAPSGQSRALPVEEAGQRRVESARSSVDGSTGRPRRSCAEPGQVEQEVLHLGGGDPVARRGAGRSTAAPGASAGSAGSRPCEPRTARAPASRPTTFIR